MDDELLLFDRINVIRDVINKYGEDKFYLSFSGGKDSTVLHYLLDMAIPDNKIPRVFSNTGIEYTDIVKFVKELANNDDRFVILNNRRNITQTLREHGYPFKSKTHSHWCAVYRRNREACNHEFEKIAHNPSIIHDINYYDSLNGTSTKAIVKYVYGMRERERESCTLRKNTLSLTCFDINSQMSAL